MVGWGKGGWFRRPVVMTMQLCMCLVVERSKLGTDGYLLNGSQ